jgi:VanZ like family
VKIHRGGAALSLAMLAVILVATLTPLRGSSATTNFWCIWCGQYAALDILANVVMFVPLGFALAMATDRRWINVLACFVLTVTVELLQIRVISGRDASLSDILANSLGGLVGVELGLRRLLVFRPRARAAFRFALGWCGVFAIVCGLTVAGLRPARVPRSLWVQWTPSRPSFDPFTGRLLDFRIDDIDLPRGYPAAALGIHRLLQGPEWQTTTTVSTEGMQHRRSLIARIAEEFTVLVSVEQLGWDFGCWHKTRSGDFRFRSPKVAVRDAFRLTNNESSSVTRLTCGRSHGTLIATVEGKREVLRLSPSLGWLLVGPFDVSLSDSVVWINALWLFGLTFPAGYWFGMIGAEAGSARGRKGLTTLVMAAALAFGLTIAPTLAGTARATASEWAVALFGLAAGAAVSVVVQRGWPISRNESQHPT